MNLEAPAQAAEQVRCRRGWRGSRVSHPSLQVLLFTGPTPEGSVASEIPVCSRALAFACRSRDLAGNKPELCLCLHLLAAGRWPPPYSQGQGSWTGLRRLRTTAAGSGDAEALKRRAPGMTSSLSCLRWALGEESSICPSLRPGTHKHQMTMGCQVIASCVDVLFQDSLTCRGLSSLQTDSAQRFPFRAGSAQRHADGTALSLRRVEASPTVRPVLPHVTLGRSRHFRIQAVPSARPPGHPRRRLLGQAPRSALRREGRPLDCLCAGVRFLSQLRPIGFQTLTDSTHLLLGSSGFHARHGMPETFAEKPEPPRIRLPWDVFKGWPLPEGL